MRPTFMGFETAKRGLMVNQKALDIVGNNLGNLGVTGYT
ncbi:MAG: flagellar basal body protein, partial [Angelakisella sp.]